MSQSTLWVLDKDFNGTIVEEFSNSWLLTPPAMDVLFVKYMPEKAFQMGQKLSFFTASMFDESIHRNLNQHINESPNQEDRIVWEFAMQQVFSTKDKAFVARCLQQFLQNNQSLAAEYGEHIQERFDEVADAILALDEHETPYFMFKGTSVDDTVENWFEGYNETTDDYGERTLREADTVVCEFVLIENETIKGFANNLDFFEKAK